MINHVPSLSTCQKLKQLGYPQETTEFIHMWHDYDDQWGENQQHWGITHKSYIELNEDDKYFAAPLATELLEYFPFHIDYGEEEWNRYWFHFGIAQDYKKARYFCTYADGRGSPLCSGGFDNNALEALAQMLIYLGENKIVSFEKEKVS